jgi:hypothetical protein
LTACESSRGESDGHWCAVKIDCGERVFGCGPERKES